MSAKEVKHSELHNMLKTYQQALPKGKQVLIVSKSSTPKALKPKDKSNKKKGNVGPNHSSAKRKSGSKKLKGVDKDTCLYYNQKGHWKRDCPKAKADGVVKHGASTSTQSMFVNEVNNYTVENS